MKNLLTLALVACLSLSSCISTKARDEALLPAATLAWGNSQAGVRSDLERGIADAVEDGDLADPAPLDALVLQLDEVLALGGSRVLLRQIPWESTLLPYAARGVQDRVDDGEISQMIADVSYMERLNQFSLAFDQLLVSMIGSPTTEGIYPTIPGIGPTTDPAAAAILTTTGR